ncbi:DUF5610 domain-containing protein [Salinimonas iocasae]|uniref:DUF5610 domain-containing protein n=1 Tax=Salinimonas iocasae TaxID=2572577 RepID=A0A5B7YB19_9ALTE|nr:DUF5610 domain-containing protein [Salinimonas iocasae]QCZ92831.1 hypothetical protein FBQ74_04745 [Salinimonas iocasae]
MNTVTASPNFGQQVHQLKASRAEEGATGPLGKEVSAMAHARNAERQAEKSASETVNTTDQVELDINDNTNTDTAVTAIVTHNINEALQSADEATDTSVSLRTATEGESLGDVLRTGFSSLLSGYQQQNPEKTADEALSSLTKLLQEGVDKGFTEAQDTLASGGTLDEETISQLTASKDEIHSLINHLATAVSTGGSSQ